MNLGLQADAEAKAVKVAALTSSLREAEAEVEELQGDMDSRSKDHKRAMAGLEEQLGELYLQNVRNLIACLLH